ncbi:AraC family transcriptional regulator [Paenibacillus sp. T3-5-0-4]|nr:AraC family transcriptional regulator [Paenibacillus endoradicis]MCR8660011.1 AraC family transcriptional regulator [Paenibacillus endoradicis]
MESNSHTYEVGEEHPNRTNIGFFDMLYVREGCLYIAEDDHRWELHAGEVLILRPDAWHYSYQPCTASTTFDWLHFQTAGPWEEVENYEQGTLRGDYYTYALRVPKHVKLQATTEMRLMLEALHEAARNSSHAAFWDRQQRFLHLLQMLDEGWRSDTAKASVVVAEKAAAYLKRHYRQSISNQTLSDALALHINYITRSMSDVFDCTPQQYLLYYRIDQAKLLLIKTDWSIAQIAIESGFKQTAHFSRLFANQVRLSPLRYRKKFTH